MKKVNFNNVGFVYKFWFHIFNCLELVLPFSVFRKIIFKRVTCFSEKWVVANTLLSFASILVMRYLDNNWLIIMILVYSALRVLEIVVYQVNVLLFHPYKTLIVNKCQTYRVENPYRSIVLLGHNLLEVVFWFTCVTTYFEGYQSSFIVSLMDNTIRIFTFNYEKVAIENNILQMVFFIEVICGMVLIIISLAKFIGELPHIEIERED